MISKAKSFIAASGVAVVFLLLSQSAVAAGPGRAYQSSFGSFSGSDPQSIAVDQSNGDIYVAVTGDNTVRRFDSSGAAKSFTCGGCSGNTLTGFNFDSGPSAVEIAVDRSGLAHDGDIYVADGFGNVVQVFSNDGAHIGNITGTGTDAGSFNEPCGVAVDQSNGAVYIGDYGNRVWRYTPSGAGVSESDYTGGIDPGFAPCQVAAENGKVWAVNWDSTGPVKRFSAASFATGPPPSPSGSTVDATGKALATDPSTGDVYVDEGNKISVFNAADTLLYTFGSSADFGNGSAGVAVMGTNGNAYVADPTAHQVDVFGPPGRAYQSSFGSFSGSDPQSIAVDQSNGDIYVAVTGDNTVRRFDSSGAAKSFTCGGCSGNTLTGFNFDSGPSAVEIAVDRSGLAHDGDIYVADGFGNVVQVFSNDGAHIGNITGTGTDAGSFNEPCGVAVDQSNGAVYIGDYGNRVWRYTPSGAGVSESDYTGGIDPGFAPCQVAAENGKVWAVNWDSTGPVKRFSAASFATGPPPSPSGSTVDATGKALATDPSTGDVYVDEGNKISVFNAADTLLYTFGSSADFGNGSAGVAVMGTNGNAYVADPTAHQVDVFGPYLGAPPLTPAAAQTNPASSVGQTTATLNGELDPGDNASITDCHFDWVTDTQFLIDGFDSANNAPCAEGNSFNAQATVHADLTGLSPSGLYHYRLHVTGSDTGDATGSDVGFATTGTATPRTIARVMGSEDSSHIGGGFDLPRGIAINTTGNGGVPAGTFYVADANNHRIERFSPSGHFVSTWGRGVRNGDAEFQICTDAPNCLAGQPGSGAGQLKGPHGVAVDPATGAVYVADAINRRISVHSSTGAFEGAFGTGVRDGSNTLQFCTVTCQAGNNSGVFGTGIGGLTVHGGELYVSNPNSLNVDVFQPTVSAGAVTGVTFDRAFGTGFGASSLPAPTDVAVDSSGNAFVLDASDTVNASGNNRIQEYDSSDTQITPSFGSIALTTVFGSGKLDAVAVDSNDHLFVAGNRAGSSKKLAVAELNPNGTLAAVHGTDMTSADLNQGIAVAPAALGGNLYVGAQSTANLQGLYVVSDAIPTMNPVTVHAGTTATFGGTVASKNFDTDYHFEYSTDGTNWTSVPTPDANAGTDPGTIPVSTNVTGLVGSETYHVRLVQDRGDAGGGAATSQEVTFTTDAAAPEITSPRFDDLTESSITLKAKVNPENQQSSYHFEYVDDTNFLANSWNSAQQIPGSDASIGSGGVPVAVSQFLSGLAPSTLYHFRVVASNGTGTTNGPEKTFTTLDPGPGACPNAAFRLGLGANLPDCRAYELVTPADAGGVSPTSTADTNYAAATDGNSFVYGTFGQDLPGTQGNGNLDRYTATRSSDGWQSSLTGPNGAESQTPTPGIVSPDLAYSSWFISHSQDAGSLASGGLGSWLRLPNGSFERIGIGSLGSSKGACAVRITPNAGHIIFQTGSCGGGDGAAGQLEPNAPATGTAAIYDRSPGGPTQVVSLLPGDVTPSAGASYQGSSRDGSAVAFKLVGDPALYVRVGGTTQTVTASGNVFAGVSGGGGAVFYLTGGDLYRYDTGTQTSAQITSAGNFTDCHPDLFPGPHPSCLVNIPEDGQHAYFASRNVLASGGQAGQDNFYYWDGSSVGFIGILDPADVTVGLDSGNHALPSMSHWTTAVSTERPEPAIDTSRTTPDGTTIAFQSKAQLTDFDNAGKVEIYRYTIGDSEPTCVSCDPSGDTPSSGAKFLSNGGIAPRNTRADVPNMSSDGRTVTFESGDALEAGDSNGKQDVYRWTKGRGTELISSGRGSKDAYLYDVTADASDIFILVRQALVPNDFNAGAPVVYDARVNGGIASQFATPPPGCSGDACQGPPTPPPSDPNSGSSGYSGPGNQGKPLGGTASTTPTKCGKHKKLKNGKCVKKKGRHK